MASASEADPPAKKIGPEDINPLFDRRGEFEVPAFTAGMMTNVLMEEGVAEEINRETVRRHLEDMVRSDEYDVKKFKLGARTVVYGRPDDPGKVTDGGIYTPSDTAVNRFLSMFKLAQIDTSIFERKRSYLEATISLIVFIIFSLTVLVFNPGSLQMLLIGGVALLLVYLSRHLSYVAALWKWGESRL